ncbi:hypothetical protein QTP81_13680 [Alteromonas sp. ASW11-36]|uniref:Cardiolipin synthase N-terminal domain-containing protein n=1 Tax=Alteromonas arenosi TaxID=3055817 RepID=A0ABT7SZP5_9ALTE|nr:hypothetical protein [Alteromonas sp. ASW11-36]MDM7861646.1 hypothetical protein [Alteromonas sp. ASW11-36]
MQAIAPYRGVICHKEVEPMTYYWIGAGLLFIINLYVSVFLCRRDDLERIQKGLQVLIVWLIPLLGAVGLWLFYKNEDDDKNKPDKHSFGGGSNDSIGAQ